MNKWIIFFVLFTFLSHANESEWRRIQPGIEFDFPRDHGTHNDTQTEWWYVTGQVSDDYGREFGYQFTIFRFGIIPEHEKDHLQTLLPNHLIMGHMAIADIKQQQFYKAERIRRAGAGFAGALEEEMHAWIGDWEIKQDSNKIITVTATDLEQSISLQLKLSPHKNPVFHGENGYSQKGDETGNASAYYSYTRLTTEGSIAIDGTEHRVSGTSWFDHEYGSSQLGEGVAGWDWWGMHLDDGSELMLYQLRYEEGGAIPQSSATIVKPSGESITVNPDDWNLTPFEYWHSKESDSHYPIEWRIEIPKHEIDINVKARLKHAEMVTNRSTGVTYWEGPVGITGTHSGAGYMELTGYADTITNTF